MTRTATRGATRTKAIKIIIIIIIVIIVIIIIIIIIIKTPPYSIPKTILLQHQG